MELKLLVLLGTFLRCISVATGHVASSGGGAKAAYFMSNLPHGNGINALAVDSRGLLSEGTYTATGGKGGRAVSTIGVVFALASQSSIQIAGSMLFAVNAGSNTLSMLAIDPNDPLNLTLVGTPVDTMGDFPTTIAVQESLNLVCVANTGAKSGIACFKYSSSGFTPSGTTMRLLPLEPEQSTPPVGPFNTVSEIFFNTEGTALWATVKGDPAATGGGSGYFASFPVVRGTVAYRGVTSSPKYTEALFGSVPLPGNHVVSTDPTFGAALLSVSKNGVASTVQKTAIPNQAATCWAVHNPATNLVYVTDAGFNQITSINPATGALMATTVITNGNPGMIEIRSAGKMLYALSQGNSTVPPHVVVMEAMANGKARALQNFEPKKHAGVAVQGMALMKS